jgi:sec-independent protein translocase protein TatC
MFILGASFVYYILMPMAIRFFLGFEAPGGNGALPIEVEARVSEYLGLVMMLIFAFGLCFQLPILLTLLGRVGIVTSDGLKSARRYAIVGVFVLAAVVTPPDVISQFSLAVPLILLYEVSVWLVRMIERKREKEDAAASGTSAANT